MRKVFARLALGLGSLASLRATAEPLHLDDVLQRVMEVGPERAVAVAQSDVTRAEIATARAFPNPYLALTAGQTEPRFSAALGFRLPIFGQRTAQIEAAQRGYAQAIAERENTTWRLRRDARVAYYAAVRARDEVETAVGVEALTKQVADMTRERYEVGPGTRLEQEQARLVFVRAQQDVSDRRAVADVARLELARFLALPAEGVTELADGLDQVGATPPLGELLATAEKQHPELIALAAERTAALARAHAARVERRPSPTLEIGVELLDPRVDPVTNAPGHFSAGPRGALTFDLPVFNLNAGPIARAEAEAQLALLKRQAALLRVGAAVQSSHAGLIAAQRRAKFFRDEYLPSAKMVEQMAREGYTAGRSGLLPLIEAQRAVLEAMLGRAEALYSVQVARADLEEASGARLSAP